MMSRARREVVQVSLLFSCYDVVKMSHLSSTSALASWDELIHVFKRHARKHCQVDECLRHLYRTFNTPSKFVEQEPNAELPQFTKKRNVSVKLYGEGSLVA